MTDRLTRVLLAGVLVLLAAIFAQPYINESLFSSRSPRPIEARGSLAEAERTTIAIFNAVSPSVLQVIGRSATQEQVTPEGDQVVGVQTGTGFVWDEAGHIVTNNHVVQGTSAIDVRIADGRDRPGRTSSAPRRLRSRRAASTRLAPAAAADRDRQLGRSAGRPERPSPSAIRSASTTSLTTGIISALRRRLPTSERARIADVIQTDAAINPGNSGGPLLDSAGRLIGVNTAIYSPSGSNAGIGFAIPVDAVNRVVPQLIKNGRVPTPGIGVIIASDEAASQLGTDGVVVVRVVPDSPAAKAGLRGVDPSTGAMGDVIVGANGVRCTVSPISPTRSRRSGSATKSGSRCSATAAPFRSRSASRIRARPPERPADSPRGTWQNTLPALSSPDDWEPTLPWPAVPRLSRSGPFSAGTLGRTRR